MAAPEVTELSSGKCKLFTQERGPVTLGRGIVTWGVAGLRGGSVTFNMTEQSCLATWQPSGCRTKHPLFVVIYGF